MGKTGKKTKSDRVNALRKQYDAFLDQDKKRKERNEFILGSLEKMRLSTTAVVPVRHNLGNPQISKYNFIAQERPEYLRNIRFDDSSILRSRQIDESPACATKDEEILLQEIGKKYILIPKLRLTSENNVTYYNPPSANNDTDWRKKYNILDELKKIEKEGSSEISMDQPVKPCDNFNNDHELNIAASKNIREQKQQKINRNLILKTQQNDEKMQVSQLQNKTKTVPTNDYDYKPLTDCKPLLESNQNIIPNIAENTDFKKEVLCKPGLTPMNIEKHHISDLNDVKKDFYPHDNVIKVEQRNDNKNEEKITFNKVQNIQENEIKVIDNVVPINIDTDNVKNEAGTENNTQELIFDSATLAAENEKENTEQNLKKDEIVAHPVDTVENQEPYTSTDKIEHYPENIQELYEQNNETTNISDNAIPSQIDEFEAEQKEMFYSEETNYNQNLDTMGNITQNEEYTNEQYSHYNESQQDQPYYSEINEHEESTERYDPNYQQQYVENYEENGNVAHYEDQQYEGDTYDNQQEVTHVNYEQQPDQQEVSNVNYEQPDHQEVTTGNYEEQPVNYEYEHTGAFDNPDPSHVEDTSIYDGQASEHVNYETQIYNEVGEIEHPAKPDQNVYESQQNYVENTEHEPIQNLEQQLHDREGYSETQNTFPETKNTYEPASKVDNINHIESNIKVT